MGERLDDLWYAIREGAEFGVMIAVALLSFLGVIGVVVGLVSMIMKVVR